MSEVTVSPSTGFNVYKAINAVQASLAKTGIAKNQQNQQQRYNFRGIDDIYNALASLLAVHGLCIMPTVLERVVVEVPTQRGGKMNHVTVKVRLDFISSEDGSCKPIEVYGEAMDSGDKATNKAMTAAYKVACFQVFCIPTEGDNDADSTTHYMGSGNQNRNKQQNNQQQSQPYNHQPHQIHQPQQQIADQQPAQQQAQPLNEAQQTANELVARHVAASREEQARQQSRQAAVQETADAEQEKINEMAGYKVITPVQFKQLQSVIKQAGWTPEAFCQKSGVTQLGLFQASRFNGAITWLQGMIKVDQERRLRSS